jgi:hypothetical protein
MRNTSQMNEDQYTNVNVESVISILQSLTLKGDSVDGETMEYILERVGMTDQMLRQLVMNNPQSDTIDLLNEKIELDNELIRSYENV